MPKGSNKVLADGKKSPEVTRLALAFLGGVALTLFIMSITAGQMMQGYMKFGDLTDVSMVKTAKVTTQKDMVQKDMTGKRIMPQERKFNLAEERVAKVKDMRGTEAKDISYKLADGSVVDATQVSVYTLDNGISYMADDVSTLEVVEATYKEDVATAKVYPAEYKEVDLNYVTAEGTTFNADEVATIKLSNDSVADVATLTLYNDAMKDSYYVLDYSSDLVKLEM